MFVRIPLSLAFMIFLLAGCITNNTGSKEESFLDPGDSAAIVEIYTANGIDLPPRSMILTNDQGRIIYLGSCTGTGDSRKCWKISKLTPAIGRLTELEYLEIDGALSEDGLPPELWSLPSLTRLTMTDCRFSALPEGLGNLGNLEFLSIRSSLAYDTSHQNLRSLPASLARLRKLRMLVVAFVGLESLPSFLGDLESLTFLQINGNRLDSLPSSLGNLEKLEYLQADQNRLASLPGTLGGAKALKTLSIGNNRLAALPPSIGDIDSLRALNLIGNRLVDLPPELGRLRKLEMLALSYNPLARIPDEVTHIQSLKPENGEFLQSTNLCRASLSLLVLDWLDRFFPNWKQGANC